MPNPNGIPDRIYQTQTNAANNLSLTPGDSMTGGTARHFGNILRVVSVHVHWDTAITAITHKVTLNSGLGGVYDVDLKEESFTGQDWVWTPQGELPDLYLFPRRTSAPTTTELSDALDVAIGDGGASRVSGLVIVYEVL